ncbi:MAG: glycosyltransferase family 2 protein [Acidobacteriota bacterium]
MIEGNKVAVVLPAYNAAQTLRATYADLPMSVVDEVLLVDDSSIDATVDVARSLGIHTFVHTENLGYGGNQKTCYRQALACGADIVVMVHPDYQYTPRLAGAMASMIASGEYDVVLGSRILGGTARTGGMPLYKYVANRFLTAFQNVMQGAKLSEYHTGFRAFHRRVLEKLPLEENSNDFLFDNQMLAQCLVFGFRIGELSCPTRYFAEASSIGFLRAIRYGLGVVRTSLEVFAHRRGWAAPAYLSTEGRKL